MLGTPAEALAGVPGRTQARADQGNAFQPLHNEGGEVARLSLPGFLPGSSCVSAFVFVSGRFSLNLSALAAVRT